MEFYGYVALGLVMAAVILGVGTRNPLAARILTLSTMLGMTALMPVIVAHHPRGDGFLLMALAAASVFLHLPIVLAGAAFLARRSSPRAAIASGVCAALLWAIAFDSFVIEPRWLETKRVVVETDKLTEPLRIVVLSDIQTDEVGPFQVEALRRAMAEKPDLVLLPGDFVQLEEQAAYLLEAEDFRQMVAAAGLAKARLGAIAVQGNTEWADRWVNELYADTGVRASQKDTFVDLGGGIGVTALSFVSGFNVGGQVPRPEAAKFHIVVAHGPDFALGDVDADLMVAGHTHGGQVQLPLIGPLLTLSHVPRAWADDTTRMADGRTLVVSRGVGMERANAPRLRFLCRPQIVVIDVLPSQEP